MHTRYLEQCNQGQLTYGSNKTIEEQRKYKEKAYEEYNMRKINNIMICECGIKYVCFRDFHMYRHINSKKHKKII